MIFVADQEIARAGFSLHIRRRIDDPHSNDVSGLRSADGAAPVAGPACGASGPGIADRDEKGGRNGQRLYLSEPEQSGDVHRHE